MIELLSGPTGAWFLGALLLPTPIWAQGRPDTALTVTTAFEKPVRVDEPIELHLNRPLEPASGRLAVIIGHTDWSGLLESTDRGAILRRSIVPLPIGEHDLQVYLVSPSNEWIPLGRYPLRVVADAAPLRTEFDPTFELANKGQLAEGHRSSTSAPPRASFQDFGVNGGIRTTVAGGGWTARMRMSILGVSNRSEALRVREQPDSAPLVDLADYLVSAENDRIALSLGHVTFGNHPHLFNAFASRGRCTTCCSSRVLSSA